MNEAEGMSTDGTSAYLIHCCTNFKQPT